MLFKWGWFTDPMIRGDYPEEMKVHFGDTLPAFTEEEKALLKGSADFIGVNTYTSRFISPGEADGMVRLTCTSSGGTAASRRTAVHLCGLTLCLGAGCFFVRGRLTDNTSQLLVCCLQPWVETTTNATGHSLGLLADVPWLYVTPVALRGVLNWITARYGMVEIKVCHSKVTALMLQGIRLAGCPLSGNGHRQALRWEVGTPTGLLLCVGCR